MSTDELGTYIYNGITNWGEPVSHVLENGELLVNQTRSSERTPLITVLLEGLSTSYIYDEIICVITVLLEILLFCCVYCGIIWS